MLLKFKIRRKNTKHTQSTTVAVTHDFPKNSHTFIHSFFYEFFHLAGRLFVLVSTLSLSPDNGWCSCFLCDFRSRLAIVACVYVCFCFLLLRLRTHSLSHYFLFSLSVFVVLLFFFSLCLICWMRKSRNFIQMRHITNHFARKWIYFFSLLSIVVLTMSCWCCCCKFSRTSLTFNFTRELRIENKK